MLTGNLEMLSDMDSGMFSNMLKVLENRAGVFAKLIDIQERRALSNMPQIRMNVPGVGGGASPQSKKGDDTSHIRDNKGETQLQKLDKIVAILTEMNNNVVTIDSWLQSSKTGNDDLCKKEL